MVFRARQSELPLVLGLRFDVLSASKHFSEVGDILPPHADRHRGLEVAPIVALVVHNPSQCGARLGEFAQPPEGVACLG